MELWRCHDKVKFFIQGPSRWQTTKLPDYDLTVSQTNPEKTESGQLHREDYNITVDQDATYNQPYWLQCPYQATVYNWPHTPWAGEAFEPPLLMLQGDIIIDGENITLTTPIIYREAKHLDVREIIPKS